jgi:hypothetical protein
MTKKAHILVNKMKANKIKKQLNKIYGAPKEDLYVQIENLQNTIDHQNEIIFQLRKAHRNLLEEYLDNLVKQHEMR